MSLTKKFLDDNKYTQGFPLTVYKFVFQSDRGEKLSFEAALVLVSISLPIIGEIQRNNSFSFWSVFQVSEKSNQCVDHHRKKHSYVQ